MAAVLRGRFPGVPILHLNDLSWPVGARPANEVPTLPVPFRLDALLAAVARPARVSLLTTEPRTGT